MTGTTSNTQESFTLPKGAQQTLLLLDLLLQQGFNKARVQRYSTRLNRQKGKTPRICRLTGNQGKPEARIKINFCRKNLLMIDPYFQCFGSS